MSTIEPIGGFFEIEIPKGNNNYHKQALALSTGRACLNLILETIKPSKIYIPYYTCDALFEPMTVSNTQFSFYEIDEKLDPLSLPKLKDKEYIVYINYFGIKKNTVNKLIKEYGNRLIIDNSHDFYSKGNRDNWSFTTARKYFGVPDGAFLYSPKKIIRKFERNQNISVNHLLNRFIGKQAVAFDQFQKYEKTLNSEIKRISKFSESILSNIDYDRIKKVRKDNLDYLMNSLNHLNILEINNANNINPYCYPFLPKNPINKELFYNKNIFIPSLWLDTLTRSKTGFVNEKILSKNLLPLPIDHRYTKVDLKSIVVLIQNITKLK